jgi:hypothetical protein
MVSTNSDDVELDPCRRRCGEGSQTVGGPVGTRRDEAGGAGGATTTAMTA